MTRLRSILVGGNAAAGLLYIFVSLTAPTVRIPQETINLNRFTLTERAGDYELDPKTRMHIRGPFTLSGGTFRVNRNILTITGDVYIGKDATFINDGTLILAGTGHKITTVIPATYSGGLVFTATGYTYRFTSFLKVEPIPVTVIDRAVYSGSTLITATGSHIELNIPSLGNVETR